MGTYYNGANCDIYIGKGAGKKLIDEISTAKRNVKIVSPYLSPILIKQLINLHKKGIKIHLVTTDNIEDFYGESDKNIHQLIHQKKVINKEAEAKRSQWENMASVLLFISIGLIAVLLLGLAVYQQLKLILGLVPIAGLLVIRNSYQEKIRKQRIYHYKYTQLFPFKVFMSQSAQGGSRNTFIHSKIYIIDDQVVYMGSLNFTASGIKDNYETRIRTTDIQAVQKIVEEFNALFYHSKLPERDIQFWGSQLYKERPN